MPRASRKVEGTPGHDAGTATLNTGCGVMGTLFRSPESAAFSMARVYRSFMRSPTPKGPPPTAGFPNPAGRTVAPEFFTQQRSIGRRGARQEGGAEAGAKSGLRLLAEAAFGSRHLGGVAAQEVVHGLFRREARDRRQHAESIGCQKNQVGRVASHAGDQGLLKI